MDTSVTYIVIAILALAIVALLAFVVSHGKSEHRLSPLAGLAFALILAGIVLGESRFAGYTLVGVGVLLAIVDIIRKWQSRSGKFS